MKRWAVAIALMATTVGGCAMLDQGPSRNRRGGETTTARETAPKTSPFEALASRFSSRKCKQGTCTKEVFAQSDDSSGPALAEVKPAPEVKMVAEVKPK